MSASHPNPMFSPYAEQKAMEGLHALLLDARERPIEPAALHHLREGLEHLVDGACTEGAAREEIDGLGALEGGDYAHPIKVAELAILIGHAAGQSRAELASIALSAALMNAGYVALQRSVLDEPRRLLEGEWDEHVHTHPAQGAAVLAQAGLSDEQLRTILQHHERWDGSGYPSGLRDEEICIDARILAVADTYVSLRSMRPFRAALPRDEAVRLIAEDSGTRFDPRIAEIAMDVIALHAGERVRERDVAVGGVVANATEDAEAARRAAAEESERAAALRERAREEDEREASEHAANERAARERVAAAARADAEASRAGVLAAGGYAASAPMAVAATAAESPADVPATERGRRHRAAGRSRGGLYGTRMYVEHAVDGAWHVDAWDEPA